MISENVIVHICICKHFLPALFQGNISYDQIELFFLPVRLAGIGMRDPTKTATTAYHSLKLGTQVVYELQNILAS